MSDKSDKQTLYSVRADNGGKYLCNGYSIDPAGVVKFTDKKTGSIVITHISRLFIQEMRE